MSLVLYPDSDSDSESGSNGDDEANAPSALLPPSATALKRKRDDSELPPLPSSFHDLYSTNVRISTSDDPGLHGGRKRTVPHIDGNWPSHVYLEWIPAHTEAEQLHGLIESIQEAIDAANKSRPKPIAVPDIVPALRSPLGAPLPLHISLSRTLQIKTDDREHFLETLRTSLRRAAVRPFTINYATLKWVSNFERNRWFLVLAIAKPARDELNRLLEACNDAADKCGHPRLYVGGKGDGPMENVTKRRKSTQHEGEQDQANPASIDRTENFHISIAWNLVEPHPEWIALLESIDVKKHLQSPQAPFDAVKAKIGNAIHNMGLSTRKSPLGKRGGILGLG